MSCLPSLSWLQRRSSLGVDIIDALDLVEKVYQKRDEVIQKGPKHNLMSKLEDVVEKEIIGYMKSNKVRTETILLYSQWVLDFIHEYLLTLKLYRQLLGLADGDRLSHCF